MERRGLVLLHLAAGPTGSKYGTSRLDLGWVGGWVVLVSSCCGRECSLARECRLLSLSLTLVLAVGPLWVAAPHSRSPHGRAQQGLRTSRERSLQYGH